MISIPGAFTIAAQRRDNNHITKPYNLFVLDRTATMTTSYDQVVLSVKQY